MSYVTLSGGIRNPEYHHSRSDHRNRLAVSTAQFLLLLRCIGGDHLAGNLYDHCSNARPNRPPNSHGFFYPPGNLLHPGGAPLTVGNLFQVIKMTVTDIIQTLTWLVTAIGVVLLWQRQKKVLPHEVLSMEAERAKIGQEIVRLSNENTAELLKRIDAQDTKIATLVRLLDDATEKIQVLEQEVSNLYDENERLREWGKANVEIVIKLGGTPVPIREPGTKPKLPRTLE